MGKEQLEQLGFKGVGFSFATRRLHWNGIGTVEQFSTEANK